MTYTIANLIFAEDGYYRFYLNGKEVFTPYSKVKTISICGKSLPTHRAIGYAMATPYQRARFSGYDVHHINHCHADNRISNLQVLTVAKHRKLHAAH